MAAAADLRSRLSPDLAGARELSAGANVIPIRMSFTDDCETPVSALLKLRGDGPCFLLESAERGQVGRYSFRIKKAVPAGATLSYRVVVIRKGEVVASSDEQQITVRPKRRR